MENFFEVVIKILVYAVKVVMLLFALSLFSTGFAVLQQIIHRLICCIFPKYSSAEPPAFGEGIFDKSAVITFAFVLYLFGSYIFDWDFLEAQKLLDFITGTW